MKVGESKAGGPLVVDPVLGLPLDPQAIVQMTPEDALKYIERYNNVKSEESKGNKTDDTVSADVDENGEAKKDDGESKENNRHKNSVRGRGKFVDL